jgi:hypothetical protein
MEGMMNQLGRHRGTKRRALKRANHERVVDAKLELPVAGANDHGVYLVVVLGFGWLEEKIDPSAQRENHGIFASMA